MTQQELFSTRDGCYPSHLVNDNPCDYQHYCPFHQGMGADKKFCTPMSCKHSQPCMGRNGQRK